MSQFHMNIVCIIFALLASVTFGADAIQRKADRGVDRQFLWYLLLAFGSLVSGIYHILMIP